MLLNDYSEKPKQPLLNNSAAAFFPYTHISSNTRKLLLPAGIEALFQGLQVKVIIKQRVKKKKKNEFKFTNNKAIYKENINFSTTRVEGCKNQPMWNF